VTLSLLEHFLALCLMQDNWMLLVSFVFCQF
jgi:hypothetical protein